MRNDVSNAPKGRHTKPIVLVVVAALLVGGWFVSIDLHARDDYAKLNRNVDRINQNIIVIDQAQEDIQKAMRRGDGILSKLSCLPDLSCPYIQRTWYVPTTQGMELQGVVEVLQISGYALDKEDLSCVPRQYSGCAVYASNQDISLTIGIDVSDSNQPSRDVSPNVWVKVTMNAELNGLTR